MAELRYKSRETGDLGWWATNVIGQTTSWFPNEIRSRAIVRHPTMKGMYIIEANAAEGVGRCRPEMEILPDVQSDEIPADQVFVVENESRAKLRALKAVELHLRRRLLEYRSVRRFGRRAVLETGERIAGPSPSTISEVVATLLQPNATDEDRQRVVLEAEMLPVPQNLRSILCNVLRDFVEENRDKNDEATSVAVGAAIRKLVANIPGSDLATVASLLDSSHRASISLDSELELVKSVVWRLTRQPGMAMNVSAEFAESLLDIVQTYANDRLLPRDRYAATSLNAVLALAMTGKYSDQIGASLERIHLPWFKHLVQRRARRLASDVTHAAGKEEADTVATRLEQLEALASVE